MCDSFASGSANTRERMVYTRDHGLPWYNPRGVLGQRIAGDIHPYPEMHDWAFFIALLVCTSFPVSRKKFLTFGASLYCHQTVLGRGSLHERRPCVLVRSYSVSPL